MSSRYFSDNALIGSENYMNRLKDFLKKTWILLLILFSPPVIVVAVFAYKEYICSSIDMTAGEWSSLFTGTFGYWGTVILGVLAFWQNQQAQLNNEVLMRYEQSRMAPVFSVVINSYSGISAMELSITNITDNIACSFSLSKVNIVCPDKTSQFYPLLSDVQDYMRGRDTIVVTYDTPKLQMIAGTVYQFKFEIYSTDIVGNKKCTNVRIEINDKLNYKTLYSVRELND